MKIAAILAVDLCGGIGINNTIPWKFKEDMKFFKQTTINKRILMGRKTFESLGSKPLKDRCNMVLTQDYQSYRDSTIESFKHNPVLFFENFDSCVDFCTPFSEQIVIIGGSRLYNYLFDNSIADTIYLTRIDKKFDCDTFVTLPNLEDYDVQVIKKIESQDGLTAVIEKWAKR